MSINQTQLGGPSAKPEKFPKPEQKPRPGQPTPKPGQQEQGPNGQPMRPGQKPEQRPSSQRGQADQGAKPNPQEASLLRQQEQLSKRLERLRSKKVASAFLKIAAPNPNDDPIALFEQISPTLDDMGLKGDAIRNKIELVIGKTNSKKENLYKVPLRRPTEIVPDTVSKLNRNKDKLSAIVWTSQQMDAYVWGPYTPPVTEEIPDGPAPGETGI